MDPPVIGLLGGIGSGKSLVAAELARHGGYLIAADQLGHEALQQPDIKARVAERWGRQVLTEAGKVDRKRLGAIVFADPRERRELEAMTHPFIGRRIREEIEQARRRPEVRLIVLDAAVMLEAGWHGVCDHLLFIDSPRPARLQRLQEGRGWSAREVEDRENAQLPLTEKQRHADVVIDNSAGPERIVPQLRQLLGRWGLR
jgi:dephospho-CoA kinase